MTARRSVSWGCVLVIAAVAPGCSSLLTSNVPAETVYWLAAPDAPRSAPTDTAPSIGVRITGAPGLDVDRVLVRGPGATLSPYAGARWVDRIPEVLGIVFRTALEDSGRFSRVSSSVAGIRSDWQLDLDVRAFYAVASTAGTAPTVDVEVRGYLECGGKALPIRLASRTSAASNTLTGIVAAFQSAVSASTMDLVAQLPPPRC